MKNNSHIRLLNIPIDEVSSYEINKTSGDQIRRPLLSVSSIEAQYWIKAYFHAKWPRVFDRSSSKLDIPACTNPTAMNYRSYQRAKSILKNEPCFITVGSILPEIWSLEYVSSKNEPDLKSDLTDYYRSPSCLLRRMWMKFSIRLRVGLLNNWWAALYTWHVFHPLNKPLKINPEQ